VPLDRGSNVLILAAVKRDKAPAARGWAPLSFLAVALAAACGGGTQAAPSSTLAPGSVAQAGSLAPPGGARSRGLELDEGVGPARSKTALGPVVPTTPPSSVCPSEARRAVGDARPTLVLQDAHTQKILGAMLSRDGRVLATGGLDGTVRVWDTSSGVLLRRVPTGSGTFGLSLSADGAVLATYAPNGESLSIKITTLGSDAPPRSITPTGSVFSLSPDGKSLAIGLRGVTLRDATTGAQLADYASGEPLAQAIAFDGSGQRLVVGLAGKPTDSPELAVLEVPSLKLVRRFPIPGASGFASTPARVAIQGDTVLVRTVLGVTHLIDLKDVTAPRTLPGNFSDAAIAAGRVWAVQQGSGRVLSFDLATSRPVGAAAPLPAHPAPDLVAVSGDGATLVAVASDQVTGQSIRIEDAATRRALRTIEGLPAVLTSIAVDPRGGSVATGSSIGAVARWDAHTGALEGVSRVERSPARSVSFDDAGATLALARQTPFVDLMDPDSGRITRRWKAHSFTYFAGYVPRSGDLVTAGLDGVVARWTPGPTPPAPAPSGRPFARPQEGPPPAGGPIGHVGWPILGAALAPDASYLAVTGDPGRPTPLGFTPAGGLDATLGAISLVDGKTLWEATVPRCDPHQRFVGVSPDSKSILFSTRELTRMPNGQELFVATLRIYDAHTGALGETLRPATDGPIASLGSTVLLGGKRPVLLAWPSHAERARLDVADTTVNAATVLASRGLFLLAGDGGGTTIVSERSGKPLALLIAMPDGEFVTTTPEGAFVSSVDGARRVGWSFSNPLEGFSFEQFAARFYQPGIVAKRLAGEDAPAGLTLARPPSVELGSVPRAVSGATVAIKAKVASLGRVDRVRVYVNGRPAGETVVCAPSKEVLVDVPLGPGKNRVSVVAYDAEGFASNTAHVDVVSTAPTAKPDLWTVTVGVSQYPRLAPEQQLEVADADARALAAALASQAGGTGPFAKLHATTLVNADVTPDSIERALDGLAGMRPEDLAVVLFAGHGVTFDDGRMVFLTSTASLDKAGARAGGVGWERVKAALERARGRVVLLLDACHSGHLATDVVAPNDALASALAREDRAGLFIFAAARGAQLSYEVARPGEHGSTSRGLELAWDGQPPRLAAPAATGHGLFTAALLEALAGQAPDRDGSGGIELGELVDYVTERVRAESNGKQTPWVVRRELFGDFVVAPAGR